MNYRIIVGGVLAGYLVLGAANSATGQVWLEAPILDVSADDDRYGGYEPVVDADGPREFPIQGPLLAAQSNDWVLPPGQAVSQPAPMPLPSRPTRTPAPVMQSTPFAVPPAAPFLPQPVVNGYGYGYGMPMAPMPRRPCPPWRPCGPSESFGGNWLFLQGFAGADFRPACANHDACLASGCYSRKACDRMYLANLDSACHNAMFPFLCRLEARKSYLGVRLFGWMF